VDGATISIPIVVDDVFTVFDVDVIVNSKHTSSSQLKGTLRHPDGTTVVLFDKPVGTQLLFTCFDDQAPTELGGLAPFTGSFQPVSHLALFAGKPAGGLWHLDVNDRAGSGTGAVSGVTLAFNGRTYVAPGGPVDILDFLEVPLPLTVTDVFPVGDVDVIFSLDHEFHGDLFLRLRAPDGTKDKLLDMTVMGAASGDAGPMVLDDEADDTFPGGAAPNHGRFRAGHPFELGLWTGIDSAGTWTLSVEDFQWGDEGSFHGWALHLTGGPLCGAATWSVNKTGMAGTSGFAPVLDLAGPPIQGTSVDLTVGNSAGVHAAAMLLVGLEPAAVSGLGGTVWVVPLLELPLVLPPGGMVLPTTFDNDPVLCGLPILAQLLHADAAAPKGVAFSKRLQVLPGDG
jgi:subtilisin-like proprotein convertase family protein